MSETAILLGQRIRLLRHERGISQEELAFKSSISAAHLGQIERAVKNPTIDTIDKIAVALDVTIPQLFSFHGESGAQEQTIVLNKILAQLSPMNESQQRDILKLIKIFRHFREEVD